MDAGEGREDRKAIGDKGTPIGARVSVLSDQLCYKSCYKSRNTMKVILLICLYKSHLFECPTLSAIYSVYCIYLSASCVGFRKPFGATASRSSEDIQSVACRI